ncbi:EAL domain-containing protein [Curvibacter sp. HBC61]|uniref:EAL domain-containing protein n=1 Tax=Curvibacter cyanobacteriorum TaxID=3026422 RepID=A0ABT5MWW1_9BURK|nr:EAL domain-containing protein [Curvibacter sp. HBC61]MDD0837786.1 EAL domain-containing protein [Curvibacter sp. HBC61]
MPLPQVKPWTAGLVAFAASLMASMAMVWVLQENQLREARARVSDLAADHAQAVQRGLERALSANYSLAALVQQGQGEVPNFQAAGEQLLTFHPGVSMLALGPQGTISQVVPLKGNERALGFNPLNHPVQRAEALLARETRHLTLAGPMELIQGGVGVVGRLPVFIKGAQTPDKFWGFTTVTIRLNEVLALAHLSRLEERGYAYQLWRVAGDDGGRQVISQSSRPTLVQPVERPLELPNGFWYLSVSPVNGWGSPQSLAARSTMALLFSALLGYLVFLLGRQKAQERHLAALVNQRTAEIEEARRHMEATLSAVPDSLFEMSLDGEYLSVQTPDPTLLLRPPADMLGQRVSDLMEAEAAEQVLGALADAHRDGLSGGRLLALPLQGRRLWFELSVARMAVPEGAAPRFVVLSRDITRRRQDEDMLRLTAKVFEQSTEAFVVTDAQERILMVNQAFCDLSGFSREDAVGKTAKLLAAHREDDSFRQLVRVAVRQRGHWQGEAWNQRKNRSRYLQWLSISRVDNSLGEPSHYIASFRDITQQKETEERIRSLAYFDALTGLPNRSLLNERSNLSLASARRSGEPVAVIYLDMDHFKNVNDSLGHSVGDELLVDFARRLKALVKEQDTVSRLGGDEFVLVVNDAPVAQAQQLAEAILAMSATPFQIGPYELSVTLSIGVALYPQHGEDFDTLHQRADSAMYQAKKSGRNQYRLFTAEIQQAAARVLQLENALRKAWERDQMTLHYQPQVDLGTGQVIGAEALLRWRHPELGQVSPAEFIPVAEDTGLILDLGEWVLRTALQQVRRWQDQGLPPLTVSVNLSPVQFRQPLLPELVQRLIKEAGIAPQLLELELTEGAAMDDPEGAIAIMDRLHDQGIRLLIDDFGTGYSSLSHLKRFQVYKLKIDQSFVRDLSEAAQDQGIVKAIIGMAQALGLRTIAEGVETEGQIEFLRTLGCDEIQGYYYSRPLPAAEFEAYLTRQSTPLPA